MKDSPQTLKKYGFLAAQVMVLFFLSTGVSRAEDCWLSVSGSGLKNGKGALNAYSASEGPRSRNAQKCWDQTGPQDTMHVMAGDYTVKNKAFWRLKITADSDGSNAPWKALKSLKGEGLVFLQGPRPVPYRPSRKEQGGTWIQIAQGVQRIGIKDFHIAQVAEGISVMEGGNTDLEFQNLSFEDTRQNIIILGHPRCTSLKNCPVPAAERSHGILIQNTWGDRYSKRHIRLGGGVSKVRVLNSHANAAYQDGDFAVGFDVENPSSDIEFVYCSARANVFTRSSYWNGDGFKTENETQNIRWIGCAAFDNGDGGFDIKTDHAYLENITSLRNNRNIRIWSAQTSVIKNANASYAKHRGGIGAAAGVWSSGALDCHFCTLSHNPIQVLAENNGTGALIRLYDSILYRDKTKVTPEIVNERGTQVELINTIQYKEGETAFDPQLSGRADETWEGGNRDFDSNRYGKMKGYHYA